MLTRVQNELLKFIKTAYSITALNREAAMVANHIERRRAVNKLAEEYLTSRPNLNRAHEPLGIFFLACTGAGKTTITKQLVARCRVTYLSNDEVKELLKRHPETSQHNIHFSEVVVATWVKIMDGLPNKAVIFDTSIIAHYRRPGSYWEMVGERDVKRFVINLELSAEQLRARVLLRGEETTLTLGYLQQQMIDYKRTQENIKADWTKRGSFSEYDVNRLVSNLPVRSARSVIPIA